ncbi:amino acid permease [Clostridium sp. 19966]|uniref:amino acid permease n=1 Tax=Clostridium sp. 19966 TaxID=2768166 RepID=UPI0028DE95EF|nr:amino acid permease [Clostridium sp. 19966]MDT8717534.1 amino acid permease [Clostridium sp. 19966]
MEKKSKGLSAGHITMMALGSTIGGSFFLGTAVAFNAAGPSVIIAYILGGVLVYFTLYALSEMTVANPDAGSFRTFAANTFGQGAGFVVGWVYWTGMILAMSSEATAASILIRNWLPKIHISLLGSLIIIVVTLANLLGADKLSKLESSLSAIKLLAILFFIIISVFLIIGIIPGISPVGAGELAREPFMPAGIKGIAGSMLIVMFAYAGFEIIGLAASETSNPTETIPKAIRSTVLALVGLYILSALALLPLISTASLSENMSPMVEALSKWGMNWAGAAMNLVLITAILSAALASMFGIGRMMKSIAEEKQAPRWLKDEGEIPYRGILFSGFIMLLSLGIGLLFPRVYLFLIASSGFATLFTYAAILAAHIRFREINGCPPEGKCQISGYPYTSWIALIGTVIVIVSMPLIPGQGSGLAAGIVMVAVYSLIYMAMKVKHKAESEDITAKIVGIKKYHGKFITEISEELTKENTEKDRKNKSIEDPRKPRS